MTKREPSKGRSLVFIQTDAVLGAIRYICIYALGFIREKKEYTKAIDCERVYLGRFGRAQTQHHNNVIYYTNTRDCRELSGE